MESKVGQTQLAQKSSGRNLSSVSGWTEIAKAKLATRLAQACTIQRTYGRSPSDLSTIVEGFARILSNFDPEKVIAAIDTFILQSPDIPTPSDLVKIIAPPLPEWRPDWAFYSTLRQRKKDEGNFSLTGDEENYLTKCEEFSLRSLRESQKGNDL